MPLDKLNAALERSVWNHSDAVIEKLRILQSEPLERNVENVHFEAFIPFSVDDAYPNVWFYLNGKDKKVGSDKSGFYAGNAWDFYTVDNIPTFGHGENERFETTDYSNVLADIVIKWFSECWWKAGGWYYPVPATICGHEGAGYLRTMILTKVQPS